METNLKVKKGFVILTVNPKIYPLETVYSAAYTFLDKAYILLDGDPKKEIIVKLKKIYPLALCEIKSIYILKNEMSKIGKSK